ncbi:ABC transporter ATP-binding protein, partial [Butyricicoccus sp. 1XD8-22]
YAMKFKRPIIMGLILLTIAVATDLAGPFIAKYIIDTHMTPGFLDVEPIVILLAIFLFLEILTAVLRYFMYIYLQIGANRVVQELRQDVFGHIQKLPIQYFDSL